MSDLPDDSPASDDVSEQPERRPLIITPEAFMMVQNLISLCINPKEVRRHLRSLHDALAAADAAEKRLNDVRGAHDTQVAQDRAELADREKKLREGETALANKREWREDNLLERERRISRLEAQWAFVGEEPDVYSGFRSAEFSSLMKARAAFGYASDAVVGLDDIAEHMREKFPPGRNVRTGTAGESFPDHVTLTRSEPDSPAGVRIRGRKNSAPPQPGANGE
jgi:hypothetical protein